MMLYILFWKVKKVGLEGLQYILVIKNLSFNCKKEEDYNEVIYKVLLFDCIDYS